MQFFVKIIKVVINAKQGITYTKECAINVQMVAYNALLILMAK